MEGESYKISSEQPPRIEEIRETEARVRSLVKKILDLSTMIYPDSESEQIALYKRFAGLIADFHINHLQKKFDSATRKSCVAHEVGMPPPCSTIELDKIAMLDFPGEDSVEKFLSELLAKLRREYNLS